jgi:copper chaperone
MTQREYQVTGMTCGHCELSVREEVEQIAGVTDITVSAARCRSPHRPTSTTPA